MNKILPDWCELTKCLIYKYKREYENVCKGCDYNKDEKKLDKNE